MNHTEEHSTRRPEIRKEFTEARRRYIAAYLNANECALFPFEPDQFAFARAKQLTSDIRCRAHYERLLQKYSILPNALPEFNRMRSLLQKIAAYQGDREAAEQYGNGLFTTYYILLHLHNPTRVEVRCPEEGV